MKKKIFLAILFIGLLVGGYAVWYVFFKPHRNVGSEKAKYTVSSTELGTAFKTNNAEATQKYINQAVLVEGDVTAIDGITVSLGNIACNVDSSIISKLSTLQPGSKVKVQGLVVGYNDLMEEVNLSQCILK